MARLLARDTADALPQRNPTPGHLALIASTRADGELGSDAVAWSWKR